MNIRNAVVLLMTMCVVASSFAMDEQEKKALLPLFKQLVKHEGNINPCTFSFAKNDIACSIANADKIFSSIRNVVAPIIRNAEQTGLNACYEDLLSKGQENLVKQFVNRNIVRTIAFMQKEYGDGEVLNYQVKQALCPNPVICTYNTQDNKSIKVTFYSFLCSLLKKLDARVSNKDVRLTEDLVKTHEMFEVVLNGALKDITTRYGLQKEIERNIGIALEKAQTLIACGDDEELAKINNFIVICLANIK